MIWLRKRGNRSSLFEEDSSSISRCARFYRYMRGYICHLLCRNKDEENKVSKGCREINEMIERNTNKQDDETILMKNMESKNVEETENKGGACGSTVTTTATIESNIDMEDDDNINNSYEL